MPQIKEIQLESRDRIDNKLIHVEGSQYKLKTPYNYRIGFNKNPSNIMFIDPAGGPLISIGTIINGMKVKRITQEGIIEFEEQCK